MKRIDGVRYTVQITNLIKEKGYNRSLKFIHRIPPFFYQIFGDVFFVLRKEVGTEVP